MSDERKKFNIFKGILFNFFTNEKLNILTLFGVVKKNTVLVITAPFFHINEIVHIRQYKKYRDIFI